MSEEIDLNLKDLDGFIGTTRYYRIMGRNITDGIKYIMENGYNWFVTDVLSVIIANKKVSMEDFLVIKLKVDSKNSTGKMIISDGNNKIIYSQNYKWVDTIRDLTLYYTDGVLMLSNEY